MHGIDGSQRPPAKLALDRALELEQRFQFIRVFRLDTRKNEKCLGIVSILRQVAQRRGNVLVGNQTSQLLKFG